MRRYRFISDESEAYIGSRNTLSSLVVNKGRPGVLGVLDTRPYTLQYTFSAAICRPNSVKWEDVSVILFQKLGAFFLFDLLTCLRRSERTFLLTFVRTYFFTFLRTYLRMYLLTLRTHLHTS